MDQNDFIITVYLLVCEHYQAINARYPLRRGGFAPALTDEEVITIESCGEYFKLGTDEDLFDHFQSHYQDWFPQLRDRTLFVRHAANLWQVKALLQQRLTQVSGQAADPVQVIDTLPLPVCTITRAPRARGFKPEADYGYCAAKDRHYYGFKLGVRVARSGMIIHYPLLPARPHEGQLTDDLVADFAGVVPADKGFIDAVRQALLAERHGVTLVTPPRQRMQSAFGPAVLKVCAQWRKRVATVGSHLTERFRIAHIRVRDLWHYQHRLIRKILAHTVGVFLNLQLRRKPLDLDGLVAT
jgi:hypothetical protein